jgi:hypothetical protein
MKRFAEHLAGALMAVLTLPGAALAQQPAAQQPAAQQAAAQPSPSHLAAATDVVVHSGLAGNYDSVTEPLLEQLRQMKVARADIRKDLNEVADMLKPEMELQKKRMVNTTARIYATNFTEAELKEIANFFKSTAGKRYVEVQFKATDEVLRETEKWNQELAEYIMVRARAEMTKRGHPLQ